MMSEGKETTINPEMISNGDPDRLSNLPDSVLTTILSLLKAREVLQTCVLSKRWRNLWAFVLCLDFNCEDFIQNRNATDLMHFINLNDFERFLNFVSMYFRFRDNATDVHTLSLRRRTNSTICSNKLWGLSWMWAGLDKMWIRYALKRNVKSLVLHGQDCTDLLDGFFTCKSLEVVCMDFMWARTDDRPEFIVPDIVFLPKLKKLHLSNVYVNGYDIEKLLFGCPALEMLTLQSCELMMINDVTFRTLKRLFLYDCVFYSELDPLTFCISAPCVEYLMIWGHMTCGLILKDMCKVKKANILIHQEYDELYNCEILCSLPDVEILNLDGDYLLKTILKRESPNCLAFQNLKKLSLKGSCMHCDFDLVSCFLKRCPNLEILTLYQDKYLCQDHTEKEQDGNLEDIQQFGCDRLRLINVVYESGDSLVGWVVGRLVQSTIGMNNVKIILRNNSGYPKFGRESLEDMHEYDSSNVF